MTHLPPPQPLDYAGPATPVPPRPRPVLLYVAFGTLLATLLTAANVLVVARFRQLFEAFGADVSDVTKAVLEFSRFCSQSYGCVVLWGVCLGASALVGRFIERAEDPAACILRRRIAGVLVLLLLGGLATLLTIALFAPLIGTISAVSTDHK